MAKRTNNHKLGDLGELKVRMIFSEAGFAISEMSKDYGEDFFVFGEDAGVIEPFRIYVQVKTSEKNDQHKSDWTIYEDCLTVRNWIIGNDLTILVRHNKKSGEYKFCVPEDEVEYWNLPFIKDSDIAINCNENFDAEAAKKLMWMARIRHYDRIVKITQPNEMGEDTWNDIPKYRLFCLELLVRLKLMDPVNLHLNNETYLKLANIAGEMIDDHEDSEDMSAVEKSRYAASFLLVVDQLEKVSGYSVGMSQFLLDSCACLLVQLMFHREEVAIKELQELASTLRLST
ncbi:DUF4365 domain-containing protein [Halomonas sp. TD01]|uniref:DUF4365 domain-containing protein n=1 Tax=Halomonas sp. TD01 TaxID=999141 RepID=UPI000214EC0B|nr:DUF4365 domain-containing protein [Halomonas sp. TD01]EGP21351.1 hypothetical protein GME_01834 [Halomonas sp. TD01]CAH1043798.1 hypothetical protein HPTD01_2276 [Halomonas sp. TD01]